MCISRQTLMTWSAKILGVLGIVLIWSAKILGVLGILLISVITAKNDPQALLKSSAAFIVGFGLFLMLIVVLPNSLSPDRTSSTDRDVDSEERRFRLVHVGLALVALGVFLEIMAFSPAWGVEGFAPERSEVCCLGTN